jgi:two-component system, sporulation sensor kinase D
LNDSVIKTTNIDDATVKNQTSLKATLDKLKAQNNPIVMKISKGKAQYLYYGDSSLLNKLKYYPVALLLIIFLFGAVVYNFYKSTKMATQNKLWAGMKLLFLKLKKTSIDCKL